MKSQRLSTGPVLLCVAVVSSFLLSGPLPAHSQVVPWVVFEFTERVTTDKQLAQAQAINRLIEGAVQDEALDFVPLEEKFRKRFLADHGVQFYVEGRIEVAEDGTWIEAKLQRTSAAPTDDLWAEGDLDLGGFGLDPHMNPQDMRTKIRNWLQDVLLFAIRTVRESTNRQRILAFCIVAGAANLQEEAGAITAALPSKLAGLVGTSLYVGGLTDDQVSRLCGNPKKFSLRRLYHHIVEGFLTAEGRTIAVTWDNRPSFEVSVEPSRVEESARALAEEAAKRASNP